MLGSDESRTWSGRCCEEQELERRERGGELGCAGKENVKFLLREATAAAGIDGQS
jgi:hypothetical protein